MQVRSFFQYRIRLAKLLGIAALASFSAFSQAEPQAARVAATQTDIAAPAPPVAAGGTYHLCISCSDGHVVQVNSPSPTSYPTTVCTGHGNPTGVAQAVTLNRAGQVSYVCARKIVRPVLVNPK